MSRADFFAMAVACASREPWLKHRDPSHSPRLSCPLIVISPAAISTGGGRDDILDQWRRWGDEERSMHYGIFWVIFAV